MKSVGYVLILLLSVHFLVSDAGRLHTNTSKGTHENNPDSPCTQCPANVAGEAFVSAKCCQCIDGWEVVSVDQGLVYCVESSVLLDETALRLLATFTSKLLDSYVDEEQHDERALQEEAAKEGSVYVSQGTAADIINRERSGELPVFAHVNSREYTRGASARYNKITKDFRVGAAQEANFIKIRTLFPFEKRFQSLNDKRVTTTFEDKPGKHPGFKKITTKVNQNSAIEIAAVAFVPTFTVN